MKFPTLFSSLTLLNLCLAYGAVDPSGIDQAFVDKAGAAGALEVEASKLALKQSSNDKVQEFARQMIADHGKLANQLLATAKKEGANAPSSAPDAGMMQKLMALNGAAFDLRYIQDIAVQGHQQAIELFSQEAGNGQNAALKQLAEEALPMIRHHMNMAQKLALAKKISGKN